MLYNEFTALTGFFPTLEHYHAIEAAYLETDTDKAAFCEAYRENRDGMAEEIAQKTDLETARENGIEFKRKQIEISQLERTVVRLKSRISELAAKLDRELEWKPAPLETAMSPETYAELAADPTVRRLTTEEAADMIAEEFGFAREKIGIMRQLHRCEINRHGGTRVVGAEQRDPLFDAWDWNYIAFSVRGRTNAKYEMVNGELYLMED